MIFLGENSVLCRGHLVLWG